MHTGKKLRDFGLAVVVIGAIAVLNGVAFMLMAYRRESRHTRSRR